MNITRYFSLTLIVIGLALVGLSTITHGNYPQMIWSTQVPYLSPSGEPHDFEYFLEIKELGFNTIFLTVPWGAVEYGPNEYDFHILDQYMNYTRALGLRVILVFFYSVPAASGDFNATPQWLVNHGELEVNPYGQPQNPPALAWWNETDRQYYFSFIKAVVSRYVNYSNFLGVLIDFGWLDDDWGPGVNGLPPGYAKSDVEMFQRWLMQAYHGNITLLNEQWGTDYRSFSQITPTPQPFIGNWPYFQEFKVWSINETYSQLFSMVRSIIGPNRLILFYWGGSIDDIYGMQMPEIYFKLAKIYNVTIVLDDADWTNNAVLFGNLARAYHVNLMMEWTPVPSSMSYYAKYASHLILGYPWLIGGDYYVFIRSLNWFYPTVQVNLLATEAYDVINGSYPRAKVALLYVTNYGESYDQWVALRNETSLIPTGLFYINGTYAYYPFDIITADELSMGLVNLSSYKYLILLMPEKYIPKDVLSMIDAWASKGGVLVKLSSLTNGIGPILARFEEPLIISNASIEAFPIVNGNSAYIALNNYYNPVSAIWLEVNLRGLGLVKGPYAVVSLLNGKILNITEGPYASFTINMYNTQGVYFIAILPIRPGGVGINVTWVNATYHSLSGTLNVGIKGLIYPPGNYDVLIVIHANASEYGFQLTQNGIVYGSVGLAEARAVDGEFYINVTLPFYSLIQYSLSGYYMPFSVYILKNGCIVGYSSGALNVSISTALTPTGPVSRVTGLSYVFNSTMPRPATKTYTSSTTTTVYVTVTRSTTYTVTSVYTSTVVRVSYVNVIYALAAAILVVLVAVALALKARGSPST